MATMLEMIGQAAIPVIKTKKKSSAIKSRGVSLAKNSVLSLRKVFSSSGDGVFFSRRRDQLTTHSFDTDNRLTENFVASAACY